MPRLLPPLSSLRVFEAAARLGSFKLAAAELGLTASAVSHGIDAIEASLGVQLFGRRGRAVALTAAGRDLLPYVSEGLSTIAVGATRVSARADRNRIAVSVAPIFASSWLIPRLAKFRALHPDVSLTLDTMHRLTVFPLDGLDLAVRRGHGVWPGTEATLLFSEALVPVGTSKYLAGIKVKGRIEWERVTLLAVTSVENDWQAWFTATGMSVPSVKSEMRFDTINFAVDAAAAGLGLALGRIPLLSEHPAAARLLPVVDASIPTDCGYWVALPPGEEPRHAVRAFRSWLISEAADVTLGAGHGSVTTIK